MYFLYSLTMGLAMAVLAPYFAVQALRHGKRLGSIRERMGWLPASLGEGVAANTAIWVHAVSVGEVLAAKPLIDQMVRRFPKRAIFLSTTTATGQSMARERISSAAAIFYFPFDWTIPVRAAFRRIRPAFIVILETEIWPNFLREARRQRVPVVFVNSRISERSFRRFLHFRKFVGTFFARMLRDAENFLAQASEDARRLAEMGAPEEKIEVTGNLKYDCEPPALGEFGCWLASQIKEQERWPILVAGSVLAGEEEAVLAAYDMVQRQWCRALLVLAPRKPESFDAIANCADENGWTVVRRSRIDAQKILNENAEVLILDSIGELAGIYSLADAVFVGGSLIPAGGHNILEPAWFSKPPVFGPSMENFREIAAQFSSGGAAVQVSSGERLGKVWTEMIQHPEKSNEMGRRARSLVEANRGATERTIERLAAIVRESLESTPVRGRT